MNPGIFVLKKYCGALGGPNLVISGIMVHDPLYSEVGILFSLHLTLKCSVSSAQCKWGNIDKWCNIGVATMCPAAPSNYCNA